MKKSTMLSTIASSIAMATSSNLVPQAGPNLTHRNTKTIVRHGRRYNRDKWQHSAGSRSHFKQFPVFGRLSDGRHEYFMRRGELVRRAI